MVSQKWGLVTLSFPMVSSLSEARAEDVLATHSLPAPVEPRGHRGRTASLQRPGSGDFMLIKISL